MDADAIKERQRQIWSGGDYSVLSGQLAPAAQVLADACAVSAGQEVLDVGAGDGNLALACAREGASVVACDLSPAMVERGRARSDAEGYEIEWVEGDAEELPFEDDRFDCAASSFGAFLAPRPELAATELFRVVRPGGTVGLATWTPEGPMAEYFALTRRYAPLADDLIPPERWGVEAVARERLEPLASHVDIEIHTLEWTAESAEAFAAQFADGAPPMRAARAALPPERFEEMREGLIAVMTSHDLGGGDGFRVEVPYAVTVARKRG